MGFRLSFSQINITIKRFKELASQAIVINFPLDDMIEVFELLASDNIGYWEYSDEQMKTITKGLKAFAEHYFRLWW